MITSRLLLEYGASVLRVVDGRTIQVIRISKCLDFKPWSILLIDIITHRR